MAVIRCALILVGICVAGPAVAQSPEALKSLVRKSEIQRNASITPLRRFELLRLEPDGTFTGSWERWTPSAEGRGALQSGALRGRWNVAGNTLCFEGQGLEYRGRSCYRITKSGPGRTEYAGTHTRTGDLWQMFISPR